MDLGEEEVRREELRGVETNKVKKFMNNTIKNTISMS